MLKKSSKKQRFSRGFSLIEISTIAIIIIALAVLFVVAMQPGRAKARDSKRITEIDTIRTALQLYYMDYGKYPENDDRWCSIEQTVSATKPADCDSLREDLEPYLPQLPEDPLFPRTENNKLYSYQYRSISSGEGYKLHTDLETRDPYELYSYIGRGIAYGPPGGGATGGGWYGYGWQYRKKITIDYEKVAANETDFPVLVANVGDSDLISHAQDDADDILFTESDGVTKLDHEIEAYDSSTGKIIFWVETNLSSATDTILYMYYGNIAAPNQENVEGTWNSDFLMVHHMDDETSNTILDSTGNNNDGIKEGSTYPTEITGILGLAQDFQGSDWESYVDCGSDSTVDLDGESFSIELWANAHSTGDCNKHIGKLGSWIPPRILYTQLRSGGNIRFSFYEHYVEWDTNTSIDTWYHYVFTFDNTNRARRIHEGTIEQASNIAPNNLRDTDNGNLLIGTMEENSCFFDGIIDEVRIHSVSRDINWITTNHNSQSDSANFLSFGLQEGY